MAGVFTNPFILVFGRSYSTVYFSRNNLLIILLEFFIHFASLFPHFLYTFVKDFPLLTKSLSPFIPIQLTSHQELLRTKIRPLKSDNFRHRSVLAYSSHLHEPTHISSAF